MSLSLDDAAKTELAAAAMISFETIGQFTRQGIAPNRAASMATQPGRQDADQVLHNRIRRTLRRLHAEQPTPP